MRRGTPRYPLQIGLVVLAGLCAVTIVFLFFTPVAASCGTLTSPDHRASFCGDLRSDRIAVMVGLGAVATAAAAVAASARRRG